MNQDKLILKALKEIMEQTGGGNTDTYNEILKALAPKSQEISCEEDLNLKKDYGRGFIKDYGRGYAYPKKSMQTSESKSEVEE